MLTTAMQTESIASSSTSIISLIIYILAVIGMWKVFHKAGESGWKSIIPIYNIYILFRICWHVKFFLLWMILAIAAFMCMGVCSVMALSTDSLLAVTLAMIIALLLIIGCGIVSIMQYYKLSKAFGHGAGFTLGLVFLYPIFIIILGFGSSEYLLDPKNKTDLNIQYSYMRKGNQEMPETGNRERR